MNFDTFSRKGKPNFSLFWPNFESTSELNVYLEAQKFDTQTTSLKNFVLENDRYVLPVLVGMIFVILFR